ncbi:helix-turn-helix domain-containing protein [Albirhodobacter sp. R86504]|uniref:helix-turn-helix domain-containing protein n=1 Tax=Albirhodobacter sp. R86504 TaxID=3093848 RepID=UPI00366F6555
MARAALTGTRIRERRTARKIKQADLAKMAGISPAYLNLIEHNRRRVSEAVLEALAEALGLETQALAAGAAGAVFDDLREAAAVATPGHEPPVSDPPELDRIEEFVGRYPGWAGLLAARHARVSALERSLEGLSERMAHDPYLADTLHEVLSSVTSLRSTAAILEETEDIEPEWRARFMRTISEESLRISRTAESLVGYLDTLDEAETGISSPQEEVEAWLAARRYLLPEVEASGESVAPIGAGNVAMNADPGARLAHPAPDLGVAGQVPDLATDAARDLAQSYLRAATAQARALPKDRLQAAIADVSEGGAPVDPLQIAHQLGIDLGLVLRRMAAIDPMLGLVTCDASGTLTFRKPVAGFALPRFGAACPLWPLYEALARPQEPLRRRVDMAGRIVQRFTTYSIGEICQPSRFEGPALRHAVMLIVPEPEGSPPQTGTIFDVGSSCRVCPRLQCPARREPSIVQPR